MEINEIYKLYLQCTKVNTDTRTIEKGELFIALKGERFDANIFAQQALDKGAAYVIIDNPVYAVSNRCILVPNTLIALQQLASLHRSNFKQPVIAIAGSNGKTTTKELTQAVLSSTFQTHCTKGNFNNHIGVPLTLLAMPLSAQLAIIEIGANHIGETKQLCDIAKPTHGIITNNGKDHLEGFGNIEGVITANKELYDYLLQTKGTAFVNKQDEVLMTHSVGLNRLFYNHKPTLNHMAIQLMAMNPTLQLTFTYHHESYQIQSQLVGAYNLLNIQAAIAIGLHFMVPIPNLINAITNYLPANNRSQLKIFNGNRFIVDCYNANPSSMLAALESFIQIDAPNKCVILGDMLELGDYAAEEHTKIIEWLQIHNHIKALLVGPHFMAVAPSTITSCQNWQAAKQWLNAQSLENYTILLKGSRGITLEKIIM